MTDTARMMYRKRRVTIFCTPVSTKSKSNIRSSTNRLSAYEIRKPAIINDKIIIKERAVIGVDEAFNNNGSLNQSIALLNVIGKFQMRPAIKTPIKRKNKKETIMESPNQLFAPSNRSRTTVSCSSKNKNFVARLNTP